MPIRGGFVLHQDGSDEQPHDQGDFAIFVDDPSVVVDHGWFRGAYYDAFTLVWMTIQEGVLLDNPQRPSYAIGNDGGLLLCTWPHSL